MSKVHVVLPNQLFQNISAIPTDCTFYLVEETLFFNQFVFHKQKIALHRASMKKYQSYLEEKGFNTMYINATDKETDIRILLASLMDKGFTHFSMFDPCDDWIERRIASYLKDKKILVEYLLSPMWINAKEDLSEFFSPNKKKFFQTQFYISERKRRKILLENGEQPLGGKWSFDDENRKKYPKNKVPPVYPVLESDHFYVEAKDYVEKYFPDNPGKIRGKPLYPTDFESTKVVFHNFLEKRFDEFGDYEDAIVAEESFLNHSVLTPMMNIGLITPNEVISEAILFAKKNNVSINSLEGFVRQIMGWREFIRGVYLAKGREERISNFWHFERKIPLSFYNGTTGILPIDSAIQKLNVTGYNHHIERLMVLGNFMILCEFDPDEVYKWFMEMYVDSYDWVMVPNVYGMSQFADGGLMSTKPYISGSNYLMKMSDYPKGDWQTTWDGLYWRFIAVHRDFFLKNPRLGMMVRIWDKMDELKKQKHLDSAEDFLSQL